MLVAENAVSILVSLLVAFLSYGYWKASKSNRCRKKKCQSPALPSAEKKKFLEYYDGNYGYDSVDIDTFRATEFSRLEDAVYLDAAGASLYSQSQLTAVSQQLSSSLYGNPHSQNDSSSLSTAMVETMRHQVLSMLRASNSDYVCVFTSGATSALKCVGECFPWSENSHFLYLRDNHNSVLGIREYALQKGATVRPADLIGGQLAAVDHAEMRRTAGQKPPPGGDPGACHLFALPAESNFSGTPYDLSVVSHIQNNGYQLSAPPGQRWFVLLDAAKACSSQPPNLSDFPADFVALSFYKIFGYPSGLGALVIRRDALPFLRKIYFGGGTVDAVSPYSDFMRPRNRKEASLEDGTVPFLSIAALEPGFKLIGQLSFSSISLHVASLAHYTAYQLSNLLHFNGERAVCLYGHHSHQLQNRSDILDWRSGIVCFNLKRSDGEWVGYREVDRLASLSHIHLRTGCFCNPGACAVALGLTDTDFRRNYEAGHLCWDDDDVIDGRPTGAVRVSFGYYSTFEDAQTFVDFVRKNFVDRQEHLPGSRSEDAREVLGGPTLTLQKIIVYPIKSCAGMAVDSWPLSPSGLLYDRSWVVVDSSGDVLNQKKCPQLCLIQPTIDLTKGEMSISSPNVKEAVSIPLSTELPCLLFKGGVKMCSENCTVDAYSTNLSAWISEAVGMECHLARQVDDSRRAKMWSKERKMADASSESSLSFVNEGQFLLLSTATVDDVASRMGRNVPKNFGPARFRPNLVVSGCQPYDEDEWTSVQIGGHTFDSLGGCRRCEVVNIDQSTGRRDSRHPLLTLASYRRKKGKILLGLLLERHKENSKVEQVLTCGSSVVPLRS